MNKPQGYPIGELPEDAIRSLGTAKAGRELNKTLVCPFCGADVNRMTLEKTAEHLNACTKDFVFSNQIEGEDADEELKEHVDGEVLSDLRSDYEGEEA